MIIDGHVHTWGGEDGGEILKALDHAGLDGALLISPYGGEDAAQHREMLNAFSHVVRADPERLFGFAWMNPFREGAEEEISWVAEEFGLTGIKLMPRRWYPYEEELFAFYSRVEEAGLPLLWHTGVLWNYLDSWRFCRPVYYEVMLNFPRIRCALAHVGWPWVNECLAVAARMTEGAKAELGFALPLFLDLSPGAPPSERPRVLRRAAQQLGAARLIWGSDDLEPTKLDKSRRLRVEDERFFADELHLGAEEIRAVMGGNLRRFLEGEK